MGFPFFKSHDDKEEEKETEEFVGEEREDRNEFEMLPQGPRGLELEDPLFEKAMGPQGSKISKGQERSLPEIRVHQAGKDRQETPLEKFSVPLGTLPKIRDQVKTHQAPSDAEEAFRVGPDHLDNR